MVAVPSPQVLLLGRQTGHDRVLEAGQPKDLMYHLGVVHPRRRPLRGSWFVSIQMDEGVEDDRYSGVP